MHRVSHSHTHPPTTGDVIHWAGLYDGVFGRFIRRTDGRIVELAGVTHGAVALDVGCGPGSLTRALKSAAGSAGKVYGIDPAPEMIERARRNAGRAGSDVDFQVGVIERLPFPDNTFDLVISRLMFHHLPGDLKRQGLAEIRRVLKPGGECVVIDFEPARAPVARGVIRLLGMRAMLHVNVRAYAALLEEIGYRDVGAGPTGVALLSFARGRKPDAA